MSWRPASPQEIEEICEVRLALEGYAARLASQRVSDERADKLARLLP